MANPDDPSLQQIHQAAVAHLRAGRPMDAAELLQRAVQQFPADAQTPFMLAVICHQNGRVPEAIDWLKWAHERNPNLADAWFLRGLIHQQQQQLSGAIDAYRTFLKLRPNDGKGLNNLGRALLDSGQVAEAISTLQQAIAAAPTNAGAHGNLGDAMRMTGKLDAAEDLYRKAISIDPQSAEVHSSLGALLAQRGQSAAAIAMMHRAIGLNPRLYSARFNLARTLQDAGQLDAAREQCQSAIELRPNSADAHNLLGNLLGIAGLVEECIAEQRRAVELKPDHAGAHSNLLLSLHYRDDLSAEAMFAEHQQWARQHNHPRLATARRDVSTALRAVAKRDQRVRIGYVSPNFAAHSVAYFFEPVMKHHDRSTVEVFCYSDVPRADTVTEKLRALSEHWRDISGKSDSAVTEMIQHDGIEILIDLAGHTAGNRMPMFAARAAPVQITWLGYPDTTGLPAMDYRLTDPIADPPGTSDTLHTEKLIRLDGGCWVYAAPVEISPGPLPALANGFITFGSFNNLPKLSPKAMAVWAKILIAVPGSRLLLKAAGLGTAMGREFVLNHFARAGIDPAQIDPAQIELLSWAPTTAAHLALYDRVDIALDTFPYNGTTTTCESLWMGVPVITLAGTSHVSRVGAALLTHADCGQWIAKDLDEYVSVATALAKDFHQLTDLRAQLRDQMSRSPLCDGQRLARQLEQTYTNLAAGLLQQPR